MSNQPKRQLSRKPLVREDINLHSLLQPADQAEETIGEEHKPDEPAYPDDISLTNKESLTNNTPVVYNKVDTLNKDITLEEEKEYDTYKEDGNILQDNSLRKENKVKKRKAKRKKEEVNRIKFTTTLQSKFIEMIEEVSLQERIRDKNEWLEKVLTYYAKKVGYDLE